MMQCNAPYTLHSIPKFRKWFLMTIALVNVNKVRNQFTKLREAYQKILPKVDPALLNDLLEREKSSKDGLPYTIKVFTSEGLNTEKARAYIIEKTGMAPAIFDNGTHYVTNQNLTLEMLKENS
jgi:hypothetical protein